MAIESRDNAAATVNARSTLTSPRKQSCVAARAEIRDAADMVDIQMGGDDMPHICDVETQSCHLRGGSLRFEETRSNEVPYGADPAPRVRNVAAAKSAVNQNQAIVGLQQQDMTYVTFREERIHCAAVEMMNFHLSPA